MNCFNCSILNWACTVRNDSLIFPHEFVLCQIFDSTDIEQQKHVSDFLLSVPLLIFYLFFGKVSIYCSSLYKVDHIYKIKMNKKLLYKFLHLRELLSGCQDFHKIGGRNVQME